MKDPTVVSDYYNPPSFRGIAKTLNLRINFGVTNVTDEAAETPPPEIVLSTIEAGGGNLIEDVSDLVEEIVTLVSSALKTCAESDEIRGWISATPETLWDLVQESLSENGEKENEDEN